MKSLLEICPYLIYSEFSGCCPAPDQTEEVYIPPSPDELYFEECAAIMEYNLGISRV
ncbi:MAG: hypothetical protein IIA61_14080 [Candidatus Marinimicrobia bacterium]|nr:hypothetical protein [Candidatus Neomarinimicrobiota bacterium]